MPGRLVVRRIPDLNAEAQATGQDTLFDIWRFHAFFTTTDPDDLDTVAADKTHRGHAIIEQVHADLKNSALAHLPSGKFTANAAWLVLAVIAFNLTRAAATLAGTGLAKATTATIRRKLITVPARIASSARRITLHLPTAWPWQTAWTALFTRSLRTTSRQQPPDHPATAGATDTRTGTPRQRGPATQPRPPAADKPLNPPAARSPRPIGGSRLKHAEYARWSGVRSVRCVGEREPAGGGSASTGRLRGSSVWQGPAPASPGPTAAAGAGQGEGVRGVH